MSYNVTLNGAFLQVINAADNTYKVNFTLANPLLVATNTNYLPVYTVPTAPTVLTLPAATIWGFYIRNTAASGNITVQQQVAGGALNSAANSELLLPGGIKMYFQVTESAGGLIAITLTASTTNVTAEILMAA